MDKTNPEEEEDGERGRRNSQMEEALKVRDREGVPEGMDLSKREGMWEGEERQGQRGGGRGRQGPRLGGPGLRAQTEVGAWREPPALPVCPTPKGPLNGGKCVCPGLSCRAAGGRVLSVLCVFEPLRGQGV